MKHILKHLLVLTALLATCCTTWAQRRPVAVSHYYGYGDECGDTYGGGLRNEYGKLISFALGLSDFNFNLTSSTHLVSWEINLGVRVGNIRNFANFEVGIKPGLTFLGDDDDFGGDYYYDDYYYDNYYSNVTTNFHMPIYTRIKFNLFRTGESSKFFVEGKFYWNVVRQRSLEGDTSFSGGIGITWNSFDWTILYYKQDLNDHLPRTLYDEDNFGRKLGTCVALYF